MYIIRINNNNRPEPVVISPGPRLDTDAHQSYPYIVLTEEEVFMFQLMGRPKSGDDDLDYLYWDNIAKDKSRWQYGT